MQDPIIEGRGLSRAMSSSNPWPHGQFVIAYVLICKKLQLIAAAGVTNCHSIHFLILDMQKEKLNSCSLSALTLLVMQHGGGVVSPAALQLEDVNVSLSLHVSPDRDWQPVHAVPCTSPNDSRNWLQQPCNP